MHLIILINMVIKVVSATPVNHGISFLLYNVMTTKTNSVSNLQQFVIKRT